MLRAIAKVRQSEDNSLNQNFLNRLEGISSAAQINDAVKKWPEYAEEVLVDSKLRDAIKSTLINLDQ